MSETFTHTCLTCKISYNDTDPDPYLCPPCNEQRKLIAKQIDTKLAGRISKKPVKSELQLYDEIQKRTGSKYVNIKHLDGLL